MSQKTLTIIGIVLALIFLMRNKTTTTAQGFSGKIANLRVDGLPMGAHLLSKLPGEGCFVAYNWTGTTKNSSGVGISWTYRTKTGLLNQATDAVIDEITSTSRTGPYNVVQVTNVGITLPSSLAPGTIVNAYANLQAAVSDASGVPTSNWVTVATAEHVSAIRIGGGAAQVSGSVATIGVTQQRQRLDRESQIRGLFDSAMRRR